MYHHHRDEHGFMCRHDWERNARAGLIQSVDERVSARASDYGSADEIAAAIAAARRLRNALAGQMRRLERGSPPWRRLQRNRRTLYDLANDMASYGVVPRLAAEPFDSNAWPERLRELLDTALVLHCRRQEAYDAEMRRAQQWQPTEDDWRRELDRRARLIEHGFGRITRIAR